LVQRQLESNHLRAKIFNNKISFLKHAERLPFSRLQMQKRRELVAKVREAIGTNIDPRFFPRLPTFLTAFGELIFKRFERYAQLNMTSDRIIHLINPLNHKLARRHQQKVIFHNFRRSGTSV
jgi:hypothetical protein